MKNLKKMMAIIMTGIFVFSLTGCGGFDASAYVKAVLDVSYKGETKDYMDFTECSEEDAQAVYQANIDSQVGDLDSEDSGISQDAKDGFEDMVKTMYGLAKYQVTDAEKDGSDYTVDIEIEPLTIFDGVTDDTNKAFEDYEANNDIASMSQEDLASEALKMQTEVYEKRLEKPTYGDKTKVTVTVYRDSDGSYGITQDDYSKIDAALFDVSKM